MRFEYHFCGSFIYVIIILFSTIREQYEGITLKTWCKKNQSINKILKFKRRCIENKMYQKLKANYNNKFYM